MELSYTYSPVYKAIIKDYLDGLERLIKFKKWDTERSRVIKEMTELQEQLAQKFEDFRETKISEYTQQMSFIESRHKNTRSIYTDPQAEMLRRQDFDLEFETWDANDTYTYLNDEEKDFSSYELAKIRNRYKNDARIQNLLFKRMEDAELSFTLDPEYKKLNEMVSILTMTRGVGLDIVYLPSENEDGFEALNLSLNNIDKEIWEIEKEIANVSDSLKNIPSETKAEWEQLKGLVKESNAPKQLTYEEFDERIFRGTEIFDPTVRFKYLKERFDDTTTDRWDIGRKDYDVLAHSRFLENKHELKLRNDLDYAQRYYSAEKVAIATGGDDEKTSG